MRDHNKEKRQEFIFALSYGNWRISDIAEIFGIDKSTVLRIKQKMPANYKPKWVKSE